MRYLPPLLVAPDRLRDQEAAPAGELLATIGYADTRWLPGDWTKALFIFEHCLVYSGGRTREFLSASLQEAREPDRAERRSGGTPR